MKKTVTVLAVAICAALLVNPASPARALFGVSRHAYIADRVSVARRGRAISILGASCKDSHGMIGDVPQHGMRL